MKINLKVLQEHNLSISGIEYYEGLGIYYQSLEKEDWDILELMVRCRKDGKEEYAGWLWFFVEDVKEFKELLSYHIQKKWCRRYMWAYCSLKLFNNNLELFEEVVRLYIKNKWSVYYIFKYCNDILKKLPDLYESANAVRFRY